MTRPAAPKRATSWDVARVSGFSRSTVNEILNGRGDRFPEQTRSRVLKAVDDLGYAPSAAARGLVTGQGSTVVVLVPPGVLPPSFHDSIVELQAVLAERGLHVVVQFGAADAATVVGDLRRLAPAAIVNYGVLTGEAADGLRSTGILVVPDGGSSDADEFDAHVGAVLVRTLVERAGKRHMVFARPVDAPDYPSGAGRFRGAAQAAHDLGCALDLISVPLELDAATDVLVPIVRRGLAVGIVCQVDVVALAVLAACRELGAAVPDEVAVIGVDATPEGRLWSPRLTTLRIDQREAGIALGTNLIRALDGVSDGDASGFPDVQLVEGDTA